LRSRKGFHMNTLIYKARGNWTSVPEEYTASPLPISETTEIVLVYSEHEYWIVVTLEPDLWFEQLSPDQKLALSPHGASNRYHFVYTANRYVGDAVESLEQRVGCWEFVPGGGLYLDAESEAVEEIYSVMADALCALYRVRLSAKDGPQPVIH
jgi:hypothetical protein